MSQGFTKAVPIDTDSTLANNSDQLVASQKATASFVNTKNTVTTGLANAAQSTANTVTSNLAAGTFIVQTPSAGAGAAQALSALGTGILKSTTGTGVVSIAAAATDYIAGGVGSANQVAYFTATGVLSSGANLGFDGTTLTSTPTRTIASGASATADTWTIAAATTTISGSTNITTANGFNVVSIKQQVLSAASALNIGLTLSAGAGVQGGTAGLYVEAPIGAGAGPATLLASHAVWALAPTAKTNTVADVLRLEHITSGTPAAGFGVGILFRGQDAAKTTGGDDIARIAATFTAVTSTAETSTLVVQLRNAGGALATIGTFYGTSAAGGGFASAQLLTGITSGDVSVQTGIIRTVGTNVISLDFTNKTLNLAATTGNFIKGPTSGTGVKIGSLATELFGYWGATPVVQPAATGVTTAGFTANASANAVYAESTFTGNVGTKAYSISDIVANLKTSGQLAAS